MYRPGQVFDMSVGAFFFVFFSGGPHFFFLFGAPEYVIIVFPVYAVAKIMMSDIGFECLNWFEKV